jgi:hypothetical protein
MKKRRVPDSCNMVMMRGARCCRGWAPPPREQRRAGRIRNRRKLDELDCDDAIRRRKVRERVACSLAPDHRH